MRRRMRMMKTWRGAMRVCADTLYATEPRRRSSPTCPARAVACSGGQGAPQHPLAFNTLLLADSMACSLCDRVQGYNLAAWLSPLTGQQSLGCRVVWSQEGACAEVPRGRRAGEGGMEAVQHILASGRTRMMWQTSIMSCHHGRLVWHPLYVCTCCRRLCSGMDRPNTLLPVSIKLWHTNTPGLILHHSIPLF